MCDEGQQYKFEQGGHPFKFSRQKVGFGNPFFNIGGQDNRQDSSVSSEQENTPQKRQAAVTLYSDDEGTAAAHHRELSQKDFNDTKSEQLMIQH